jgi:hypothetical protein
VILLVAVVAGTIAGWGIARWKRQTWHPPSFQSLWLVFLGFLPQFIVFYLPVTRQLVTDDLASLSLVCSQVILMIFAWKNLHLSGMPVLIFGLGCNLVVILVNGGFMPLVAETAARIVEPHVMDRLVIGARLGKASKDILLPESQILLPWLADRFISPKLSSYRAVYSLGDVFVAVGAFWMLANRHSTTAPSVGDSL